MITELSEVNVMKKLINWRIKSRLCYVKRGAIEWTKKKSEKDLPVVPQSI